VRCSDGYSAVTEVTQATGVTTRKKPSVSGTRLAKLPLDMSAPLTAKEVAQMADCSPKHIYDLCKMPGAIPHSRRRRRLTFDRAEIQEWPRRFKVA
jgi:predicted DNA-binding transcriptional regulator AlpA